MTVDALGRSGAPIGAAMWESLDRTMVGVATSQLAGRRLLEVRGPFGLGLKDLSVPDEEIGDGLLASATIPLVLIQRSFALSTRDLAAYEREPTSMNLGPLVEAALAVARLEDDVLFKGTARGGGLLTTGGVASAPATAWDEAGAATDAVIAAATRLDDNGFHGPYTLALAPARYNGLLRRLGDGFVTELQAVRDVATDGVVKAPVLDDGGVLLASGGMFAHIVLGQDMSLGFVGPTADGRLEFTISESLALRVLQPGAVCVLDAGTGAGKSAGAVESGAGRRRRG